MSCVTCKAAPCTCSQGYGPIVDGRLPPCPPPFPCTCNQNPCVCPYGHHFAMETQVNPNKNCCTMCSGDTKHNIWFQPGPPGFPGRCILDELSYGQVWAVLIRSPYAKKDLLRITHYPPLVAMANQSQLIQDPLDADQRATSIINDRNTLPFYTLFHGNIDGSIRGRTGDPGQVGTPAAPKPAIPAWHGGIHTRRR